MNIKEWRRTQRERERLQAELAALPNPSNELFQEATLKADNGHTITLRAGLIRGDYGNGPVEPDFRIQTNEDYVYGDGVAPHLSQEVLGWLLTQREHYDRWLDGEEEHPLPVGPG